LSSEGGEGELSGDGSRFIKTVYNVV